MICIVSLKRGFLGVCGLYRGTYSLKIRLEVVTCLERDAFNRPDQLCFSKAPEKHFNGVSNKHDPNDKKNGTVKGIRTQGFKSEVLAIAVLLMRYCVALHLNRPKEFACYSA